MCHAWLKNHHRCCWLLVAVEWIRQIKAFRSNRKASLQMTVRYLRITVSIIKNIFRLNENNIYHPYQKNVKLCKTHFWLLRCASAPKKYCFCNKICILRKNLLETHFQKIKIKRKSTFINYREIWPSNKPSLVHDVIKLSSQFFKTLFKAFSRFVTGTTRVREKRSRKKRTTLNVI